jgi:hypothetical protein
MKRIKLPATVRWAVANCLLIWFAMSLYRGFLLAIFLKGNPSEYLALLSGMVGDAGVISLMLFFYLVLSFLPSLHPFKSKKGKIFGYAYFIIWGMLIAFAFALDLIFVNTVQYRVYGTKALEIFDNPAETEVFFQNLSLPPLLLVTLMLLWIWGILIVKLHYYISRLSRVQGKKKRITIQGWVIIMTILIAGFAFFQSRNITSSNLNMKSAPYYALRANPVLTLIMV